MGASGLYGTLAGDEERLGFLQNAYERGGRFWDTGKTEAAGSFMYFVLAILIYRPSARNNKLIVTSRQVRRLRGSNSQMVRRQSPDAQRLHSGH